MLWNAIKTSLQGTLPESDFGLWIKPLECRRQDQVLELVGPDRFFCAWVGDRYLGLIRQAAEKLGAIKDVQLKVAENTLIPAESDRGGQLRLPGVVSCGARLRSLHPAFTFEQFMVG